MGGCWAWAGGVKSVTAGKSRLVGLEYSGGGRDASSLLRDGVSGFEGTGVRPPARFNEYLSFRAAQLPQKQLPPPPPIQDDMLLISPENILS